MEIPWIKFTSLSSLMAKHTQLYTYIARQVGNYNISIFMENWAEPLCHIRDIYLRSNGSIEN